jgi:hypothetical protein
MCGALGSPPVDDQGARDLGCGALAQAASDARFIARETAFGSPGPFSWGTTAEIGSYGTAAALAGRAGVDPSGLASAAGGRDYLLGRNPWGASFVTGFGPKSPKQLHHWASVFGDALPNGAVVGGPAPRSMVSEQGFGKGKGPFAKFSTKVASYEDRRANYVTSEPAIDYTAASILLIAALNGQ